MISAVVLSKNASNSIKKCLESILWCDEIIVIDDNSTDATAEIARKFGAKVFTRTLSNNFSAQRNFALEKTTKDWVLFVDADEEVSLSLQEEIVLRVGSVSSSVNGYFIHRVDYMWGRELKYGETGNTWLLRLARKEVGTWHGNVHETWHIKGITQKMRNSLLHYPHPTVNEFLQEINFYSSIRANELFEKKVKASWIDVLFYPKTKFFINYFFRQGYRDGIPGFIVAVLMSMHSFLVRGKLWQRQNAQQ